MCNPLPCWCEPGIRKPINTSDWFASNNSSRNKYIPRLCLFADYFKELLVESKKEFHAMFKRTYGAIYEQNSYVFSDLFVELETYYTWGQVNLSKVLDEFFSKLYQKMFIVLNSQFTYDDK